MRNYAGNRNFLLYFLPYQRQIPDITCLYMLSIWTNLQCVFRAILNTVVEDQRACHGPVSLQGSYTHIPWCVMRLTMGAFKLISNTSETSHPIFMNFTEMILPWSF